MALRAFEYDGFGDGLEPGLSVPTCMITFEADFKDYRVKQKRAHLLIVAKCPDGAGKN